MLRSVPTLWGRQPPNRSCPQAQNGCGGGATAPKAEPVPRNWATALTLTAPAPVTHLCYNETNSRSETRIQDTSPPAHAYVWGVPPPPRGSWHPLYLSINMERFSFRPTNGVKSSEQRAPPLGCPGSRPSGLRPLCPPPTLARPVLSHGNKPLINGLHANRCAGLQFFTGISKKNQVSSVHRAHGNSLRQGTLYTPPQVTERAALASCSGGEGGPPKQMSTQNL